MKTKQRKATSKARAKPAAKVKGKGKAKAKSAKRAAPKRAARRKPARKPAGATRWLTFVEKHGVVLASARGPVPSVAEEVAGEPIVGSWWAHPKGKAIFAALSEIDDSVDVRCFKLVDDKVTFVHRRMWPALARLAAAGIIPAGRAASIQQEHMPTGEHRNIVTPYPEWVPDDVAQAAGKLTTDAARTALGTWI